MATNYPGAIDTYTNPLSSEPMNAPSHAGQHANANDAIEAVQAELGTTPSGSESTVAARLTAIEDGTRLGANSVGATQIANDSVDTAAIQDDAVTADKIAADAVGTSEIAANAVGSSELADNAVDTAAIATGAVTPIKTVGVVQAKTANYTVLSSDSVVTADTTAGVVTLTLPAASAMTGRSLRIIKTAGANTLTVQRAGSDTIIPSSGTRTSVAFPAGATFGEMELVSNGTAWYALGGQASDESVGARMWKWEQALAASSTTAAVGWQMVHADTGWRDVSASLATGWTATKLHIRRIGTVVHLVAVGLNGSAASSNAFLPNSALSSGTGFRPVLASTSRNVAIAMKTQNPLTDATGLRWNGSELAWDMNRTAAAGHDFNTAITTDQSWPSSLPGVAV